MTNNEMGYWAWALILLSAGITLACILVSRRLRKVGLALLIAISAWAAVWLIGDRLRDSDWHNITGWVDCTRCGVWHSVGVWFYLGPPVVGVVAVIAAAVVAGIDRLRPRGRT